MGKAEPVKLENWTDITELVAMSIGTDKGRWWADASFGSELWVLQHEGKVDGTTAGKVRTAILESLAWLKQDRLVKDIQCTAEHRGKNEVDYILTVTKADGETVFIKDVWHGVS